MEHPETKIENYSIKLANSINLILLVKMDKIISLNVGGVHYDVAYTTLTVCKDTMLAKLVDGVIPSREVNDRIFIDRNGKIFDHILDFLRNGNEWMLPESSDLVKRIYLEAKFYGIEDLIKITNDRIVPEIKQDSQIELWEKYPTVIVCQQIIVNQTIISIWPKNFAAVLELKSVAETTNGQFYLTDRFIDVANVLYKNGYDMFDNTVAIVNTLIVYYFRPRYPTN